MCGACRSHPVTAQCEVMEATDDLCLPVARGRVFVRGLLWALGALLVGLGVLTVVASLDFKPTGVSNRLVEYSIAAVLIPFLAGAIWCAVTAVRWMILAGWPSAVGVFVGGDALALRLGPWGTRRYAWDSLDVRYWFEHDPDDLAGMVEAFLPEEVQRAQFLPQICRNGESESINRMVLHRTGRSEQEAADALRDALAIHRHDFDDDAKSDDDEGTAS